MNISVTVHPNSKKPRIAKDGTGQLHVYVSERAMENKANQAVTKALAEYYHVPKSTVSLMRGAKSKQKIFKIPE